MQTLIPWRNSFLLSEIISLLSDFIHDSLFLILSPVFWIHGIAYDSFFCIETLKERAESAVVAAVEDSSGCRMWRRLGLGFRGAVHMAVLLVAPVVPATALGFGMVYVWAEETVTVTEKIHFDYTCVHPWASFSFSDSHGLKRKINSGVPFGHTFSVSVALFFPESYHNRNVGMFQLTAEVISKNGDVLSKCSKPCIMPFRSRTVRVTHTTIAMVPLLAGGISETQKITVAGMVKHKEEVNDKQKRSEFVKVSMIKRMESTSIPHLNDAEIILIFSPPWTKRVLHRWRFSFSIWVSFALYFVLLTLTISMFRPMVFPVRK